VPDGTIVARLEVRAPSVDHFLLRGTFPVAPNTFPRLDGRDGFEILNWDGTRVTTQTEIVTRYADSSQGADVVEVMGYVHRPPGASAGQRLRYDVRQAQQPEFMTPSLPFGLQNVDDTLALPTAVLDIGWDPQSVVISTFDCYGNEYSVRPFDESGSFKLIRHGPVRSELRVSQTMELETFVGGTPLPHGFGVHTYISTFQGRELIGLDMRFHNAHSGHSLGTPLDDPLEKLYFDRIEVSIPSNWFLGQDYPDPFFAPTPTTSGGRNTYRIVRPIGNGKQHVMRWQGQFHRRLAISTGGELASYRDPWLDMEGQGFCVRGENASGMELWSWWNRGTSRYFPQNYQLPLLDHVGLGTIRGELHGDWSQINGFLLSGSSSGSYPFSSDRIGWGHPYGTQYGGMTGGSEIHIFEGVETAASASLFGYRHLAALHRMHTDRHPAAFYNHDGDPTTVEDWLVSGSSFDYIPFNHFLTPSLSANDPFGLHEFDATQNQYISDNSLGPWYEGTHMSFDPHDYQHFIRYTRAPKALTWLGNDSIAKDDLLMQAENYHLSYHPHPNNQWGGGQVTGMKTDLDFVAAHPGVGYQTGRGEAWGLDVMCAVYAFAGDAWRTRKLPWFRTLAVLLSEGQSTCSGFIQSQHMGSVPIPQQQPTWFWRQMIEQSITENALQGMRETVFKRADTSYTDLLRQVMMDSLYAMCSEHAWEPGNGAPWQYTAVGMNPDASDPFPTSVWCNPYQAPADYHTQTVDTYQNWSSFAYGFELTDDQLFLDYAVIQGWGPDIYAYLHNNGLDNLQNRAALLALLQRLNGDFD